MLRDPQGEAATVILGRFIFIFMAVRIPITIIEGVDPKLAHGCLWWQMHQELVRVPGKRLEPLRLSLSLSLSPSHSQAQYTRSIEEFIG